MPMKQWKALMRREWMQHRWGWLVLMVLPTAAMLVLAVLATTVFRVQLSGGAGGPMLGFELGEGQPKVALVEAPAVMQTLMWSAAITGLTAVLATLAVLIQLPGLARRDRDDRSIEFWRTLPVADGAAVAAMLVMHLLVLPTLAVSAALVGAQLVALVSTVGTVGLWAWITQPWGQLLLAFATVGLRVLLAGMLALLWLSPLLMLVAAASAWFKRWGLPVVAAALLVGMQGLDPLLPQPIVGPTFDWLTQRAQTAFTSQPLLPGAQIVRPEDIAPFLLPELPGWAWADGLAALKPLATPGLLPVIAVSALGFWLLVVQRRRAG